MSVSYLIVVLQAWHLSRADWDQSVSFASSLYGLADCYSGTVANESLVFLFCLDIASGLSLCQSAYGLPSHFTGLRDYGPFCVREKPAKGILLGILIVILFLVIIFLLAILSFETVNEIYQSSIVDWRRGSFNVRWIYTWKHCARFRNTGLQGGEPLFVSKTLVPIFLPEVTAVF